MEVIQHLFVLRRAWLYPQPRSGARRLPSKPWLGVSWASPGWAPYWVDRAGDEISFLHMGAKKPPYNRTLRRVHTKALMKSNNVENFATFPVLYSEIPEKSISKLSPFLVQKMLEQHLGPTFKGKKIGTGDLLVEVSTEEHSKKLLDLSMITEHSVGEFSPHLEYCKGRHIRTTPA